MKLIREYVFRGQSWGIPQVEPWSSKTTPLSINRDGIIQRFDDAWNPISESQYRKLQKYKRLERSWDNVKDSKDIASQYLIIEKLNWLAHNIAKITQDGTIEKVTYKMKNDFAKREIDRRWWDIIKRDEKAKMYYLTKPDWTKSIHVSDKVWEYAKKAKKRGN